METEELAHEACSIINGTVLEVQSQWTRNGRTIDTILQVQVDEVLKACSSFQEGDIITLFNPGGKIGNMDMSVPGVSELAIGNRSIFFLAETSNQDHMILTLAQGNFPIITQNGEEYVTRDPKYGHLDHSQSHMLTKGTPRLGSLTMGEKKLVRTFRDEIKTILQNTNETK